MIGPITEDAAVIAAAKRRTELVDLAVDVLYAAIRKSLTGAAA